MTNEHKEITLHCTFRNTEPTDALRSYAEEKVGNALSKFIHRAIDAHVILKVERNRQIAELNFHVDGADFNASQESDSMYSSIDQLIETIQQQLRKHKGKMTEHHRA